MICHLSVAMVLMLALAPVAGAQTSVPHAALVSEAAQDWDAAVAAYRQALAIDSRRTDLWVRLADVEAFRRNAAGAVDALEHAAALAPGEAALQARLSQAYAVSGQPRAALGAIEAAIALDPSSTIHLRALVTLATWAAEYARAADAYQQLIARFPLEDDLVLAYARVSAWAGDTDTAASRYAHYLAAHGDAAEVWLELARTESWRGNYPAAVQALATYRTKFGASDAYERELSAVLASGGRPKQAEAMVDRLLARTPNSYELNLTRAIALAVQRSPATFEALGTLRQLAPERRETSDAERFVRTLLSSAINPQLSVYHDSDRLESLRISPHATVSLATGTRFTGGYDRTELRARAGSGLEQLGGATTARFQHTWIAGAQRIGPATLRAGTGYAETGDDHLVTSMAGVQVAAGDTLLLSLERASGYVTISPRAASLGLTQVGHHALVDWTPSLRDHIAVDALYQELSDGNRRWELTVTPRRSVARTSRVNLDLGISAYRLQTDRDLDHGYYDPRRYEQYTAVVYPYFKFSENVGLSLSGGLGVQRDIATPGFRPGGTVGGEATFGIYERWVLKASSSATINRRLDSGGFRGFSATVSLIRRF